MENGIRSFSYRAELPSRCSRLFLRPLESDHVPRRFILDFLSHREKSRLVLLPRERERGEFVNGLNISPELSCCVCVCEIACTRPFSFIAVSWLNLQMPERNSLAQSSLSYICSSFSTTLEFSTMRKSLIEGVKYTLKKF